MTVNRKSLNTVRRNGVSSANFILLFMCLLMRLLLQKLAYVSVDNNEILPILLNPLRRKIQQVSADGAYDTRTGHHVLNNKGIIPNILPRSNTEYWEEGHPINETVKALKEDKLAEWKRTGIITNAH